MIRQNKMKRFRYVQINERPDGIIAKYKIGDLVQMINHSDYDYYNWVGSEKIGLVTDIKFFVQESFEPKQHLKYVTEYKVSWIDSSDYCELEESMIIKLEKKT